MTNIPDALAFDEPLRVVVWATENPDSSGHDPRSEYVEWFWLPILGPSTTFLIRYLARCLRQSPAGVERDLGETARSLGLSERPGRHAPLLRTLSRAVDFSLVRFVSPRILEVKALLPELTDRQVNRLPSPLRLAHTGWTSARRRSVLVAKQEGAAEALPARR